MLCHPCALLLITECATPSDGNSDGIDLADVELREYEWVDLSSITHFGENSIRGPQTVDIDGYTLTVRGLVDDAKVFAYDEIITSYQVYRKIVTLYFVERWDVTILWEGMRLRDLIEEAVAALYARAAVFHAVDG